METRADKLENVAEDRKDPFSVETGRRMSDLLEGSVLWLGTPIVRSTDEIYIPVPRVWKHVPIN